MATIKSIVKICCAQTGALFHYDVNYEEGFVVLIRPEELVDPNSIAEITEKANLKSVTIIPSSSTTEEMVYQKPIVENPQ